MATDRTPQPNRGLIASVPRFLSALLILQSNVDAQDRGKPDLDALFSRAASAVGEKYVDTRNRILAAGGVSKAFLEKKLEKGSGASAAERQVARVLLARLTNSKELKALEQQFHEKLWLLKFTSFSKWDRHPPVSREDLRRLLRMGLLTEAEHPEFEARLKANRKPTGFYTSMAWLKRVTVVDSKLWAPFLTEILLKGWVPRGKLADPADPVIPRPFSPPAEQAFRGRGAAQAAARATASLHDEDYVLQAVVLAGKLKVLEAGPRLLRVLQNPKSDLDLRTSAASALGRLAYKKAAGDLTKLATQSATVNQLRHAAFTAIVDGGFIDAIPELEQMVSVNSEKEPSWADVAQKALRQLRSRDRK